MILPYLSSSRAGCCTGVSTKPHQTSQSGAAAVTSFHCSCNDSSAVHRSRSYCLQRVCFGRPLFNYPWVATRRHHSEDGLLAFEEPDQDSFISVTSGLSVCLQTTTFMTLSCHERLRILLKQTFSNARMRFSSWTFRIPVFTFIKENGHDDAIQQPEL